MSGQSMKQIQNDEEMGKRKAKYLRAEVFTINVDENNKKFATCKLCTESIKTIKMTNGNTTGLKRHLEREHTELYREIYDTDAGTSNKIFVLFDHFYIVRIKVVVSRNISRKKI